MTPPGHLDDDRLLALTIAGEAGPAEAAHLEACDPCRHRLRYIDVLLTAVAEAVAEETDAVFPPERLALQRDRILRRIFGDPGSARVLTFPAAGGRVASPRLRPPIRWIAAAAAAGLVAGIFGERLSHDVWSHPPNEASVADQAAPTPQLPGSSGVRPILAAFSDEFLLDLEVAGSSPLPALRTLHALTPD